MPDSIPMLVESRLAMLEAAQNADGGWGYFPGKQSWLEPTACALLALWNGRRGGRAFDRGWALVRSWEEASGGWRACALVDGAHWATSLVVTLHGVMGIYDEPLRRGVEWLRASTGAETRLVSRVAHWLSPRTVEFDPRLGGWPWDRDGSSWVEPTAHALMALRRVAGHGERPGVSGRVALGERMLLERRCSDGGWNYGNRRVLGADLASYPETTALALLALNGHAGVAWGQALGRVERMWRDSSSPLGRAWLAACLLRYRGRLPTGADRNGGEPGDILVAAIEAIPWNRLAET